MTEGAVLGGRFRLEREIGRGGMGAVYRASDEHTGGVAAVKLLHAVGDQVVARFEREAELLASLKVPGVVAWLDHGRTPRGELYLAMEWLDGEDLTARLGRGPLTTSETVQLASSIARTLGHVHAAGVVHRDIKPPNLFLPGGDVTRPKVLDFGIAHLGALSGDRTALTARGMMLGTPGYLAPEQVRGEVEVDARADIFSLGIVVHECLTARSLFGGGLMMAVLGRVLFDPAPALRDVRPDVPPALAELVARMLHKDASERPASMLEVDAVLAEVLGLDHRGASGRERSSMLGDLERRLVGVVAAAPPSGLADDATWLPTQDDALRAAIAPLGPAHGAQVEVLADGSIVGVVTISADASEQALRTGRLALALRPLVGAVPIAVVTGRTVVGAGVPVGATLDRAVALLQGAGPGQVVADEETARWLSARFTLNESGPEARVTGERVVEAPATRRLAFRGRDQELTTLLRGQRGAAAAGHFATAWVEGAIGIGKTRLAEELVSAVLSSDRQTQVLWLAGDPMRAARPLSSFADGLRARWALPPLDEPSRRRRIESELAGAVDAEHYARVLTFLMELLGVTNTEPSTMLDAARQDAALMADQLRRALSDWLTGAAQEQPTLVVVDDVQWVDPVTRGLLEDLASRRAPVPIFVAFFGRSTAASTGSLRLGPLPTTAARGLAEEGLGGGDGNTVEAIVERAAGNPLFLTELVRAPAGERLPDTIAATFQTHLDRLTAEQRRALRAASVLGHRFWAGAVAAMVGEGEHAAATATLSQLAALGYVQAEPMSRFANELEYSFVAHLLRDTCYSTLTEADRRRGHRLAARWLLDHGEDGAESLGRHHERGGEPGEAALCFGRAARQALDGNELQHALVLGERALELGLPTEPRAALRVLTGEANLWLGDAPAALDDARDALALAATQSVVSFRAAGVLGDACLLLGDAEPLTPMVTYLLEADTRAELVAQAALDASGRVAAALASLARFEAADALLARAEATAARHPARSPMTQGRLAHARAVHGSCCGDLGAATRFFSASAEAFTRAGSLRFASAARTNLATKLLEVGCPDEARPLVDAALSMAEIVAVPYCVTFASFTRGLVLLAQGEAGAAGEALRATLPRLERLGDPRLLSAAHGALAESLLWAGDAAAAQTQAELGLSCAEATDLAPQRAAAFAVLARVHLTVGRGELALSAARRGMALRVTTRMEEREADLRLVYAEALVATGERGAAAEVLLEARDRLIERAARIEAGPRRGGFLTGVPANARTFALAREWGLPPP